MALSHRKALDFYLPMLPGSDDEIDLMCMPCDKQGTRIQVYGYCVDCSEHLCETCYQVHTMPTPCKNHVLLDKSRMPKWQSFPGSLGVIFTNCSKHNDKNIEYNCRDHDTLACNVCVAMEHRNCKIDYIQDVSKGYSNSSEYKKMKESVDALQTNVAKSKFANYCRHQEIEDNRNKVKQDIKEYRKSLDEILDKWEEEALEEADILFDGFFATNKTVEEQCDKLLEDLLRLQDVFRSVVKQEHLLYVCVKKYTKQISEQRQKFAELDTDYFHPELFVFQPCRQLKAIVQSYSMFGTINQRKRAAQILAKQKEVKKIERQLSVCVEKNRHKGFGKLVLHSLVPFLDFNQKEMMNLSVNLDSVRKELRQLEEAERQNESLTFAMSGNWLI